MPESSRSAVLTRLVLSVAGLLGAAGVAFAAIAAHRTGGALLQTAVPFLLAHAAAAVGLAAFSGPGGRPVLWGAVVLEVGTLLFAGDLALRSLAGIRLPGGIAPIGGGLMIAGWLLVAVAGLVPGRGRRDN